MRHDPWAVKNDPPPTPTEAEESIGADTGQYLVEQVEQYHRLRRLLGDRLGSAAAAALVAEAEAEAAAAMERSMVGCAEPV